MMYLDFEAGGKSYKLRLDTRATIALEKQIGRNPLAVFGNGDEMPQITTLVQVLYCALQPLNHGISLDDAYDIFDRYLEDGNSATDFLTVVINVFKVSGIIKGDKADKVTEKN
jgi:hypothetical protein